MDRRFVEVKKIAKRAIMRLNHYMPVYSAYLFGSYVTGSANEYSDIDVAVFSRIADRINIEKKIHIISRVQTEINSAVEMHVFSTQKLKEARPTNFYGHIISTGIKIY